MCVSGSGAGSSTDKRDQLHARSGGVDARFGPTSTKPKLCLSGHGAIGIHVAGAQPTDIDRCCRLLLEGDGVHPLGPISKVLTDLGCRRTGLGGEPPTTGGAWSLTRPALRTPEPTTGRSGWTGIGRKSTPKAPYWCNKALRKRKPQCWDSLNVRIAMLLAAGTVSGYSNAT